MILSNYLYPTLLKMSAQKEKYNRAEISELLDKLTLNALYAMEDKVKCELEIEDSTKTGRIFMAKTRYIMGQQSVSEIQLPNENSPEFNALATVNRITDETAANEFTFKLNDHTNEDNVVDPIKWFGVLVPQSLHQAQLHHKRANHNIVECVNINCTLTDILNKFSQLKSIRDKKIESS